MWDIGARQTARDRAGDVFRTLCIDWDRKTVADQEHKASGSARATTRGRSKKLDAAIAEATLRLLGTVGPGQVSIDAVAREVGCSRSSIYRRYPTKESLIMAAARTQFASPGTPAEGDLLEWAIRSRESSFRDMPAVLAVTFLMDRALRGTDLGALYLKEVFGAARLERAGLLSEAISRGELRPDVDADLLLDVITGALLFRVAHHPEAEPDLAEKLIRMLACGVVPDCAKPREV
jgi:AcrR family transcriptional regulator